MKTETLWDLSLLLPIVVLVLVGVIDWLFFAEDD